MSRLHNARATPRWVGFRRQWDMLRLIFFGKIFPQLLGVAQQVVFAHLLKNESHVFRQEALHPRIVYHAYTPHSYGRYIARDKAIAETKKVAINVVNGPFSLRPANIKTKGTESITPSDDATAILERLYKQGDVPQKPNSAYTLRHTFASICRSILIYRQ